MPESKEIMVGRWCEWACHNIYVGGEVAGEGGACYRGYFCSRSVTLILDRLFVHSHPRKLSFGSQSTGSMGEGILRGGP